MNKENFKLNVWTLILIMIWMCEIGNAVVMKCDFRNEIWITGNETHYLCTVGNSNRFRGDNVKVKRISGIHQLNKTNEDVQAFYLRAPELTKFPTNLNKFFPNLVSIAVYSTNITELTKADMKHFANLKYLNMFDNKIQFLREDTFEGNPKLEMIWLYDNEISHIDRRTFSHLRNLINLCLNHNSPCPSLTTLLSHAQDKLGVAKLVQEIENGICESQQYISST